MPRRILGVALVGCFVLHSALQINVISSLVAPRVRAANHELLAEATRLEQFGLNQPCLVLGHPSFNQDLAYATRCTNVPSDARSVQKAIRRGVDVVQLANAAPPAAYWANWRKITLPSLPRRHPTHAYLSFLPRCPLTGCAQLGDRSASARVLRRSPT
jgi:hypothetical protein